MLVKGAILTSVGYGYSGWAADGSFVYDGFRHAAELARQEGRQVDDHGLDEVAGPCFGDSGGPQLSGNTVLSVTSGGSKDCTGKAEGYRLDSAKARSFLGGFLLLP